MIEVDVAFAVAGFEVLALLNDDPSGNTNDGRVRWNGFEDDGAGPDFCAFTDGKRTEDFGPAGDDDVVADGRMAFSFFFTGTAEGYALIEGYVVADDRRLADDNSHTMVDKKSFTDLSTGMNFDSRKEAGDGGNNSGRDEPLAAVKEVSQAVSPNGMKAGITEQDFERVFGRRVAVLNDANVVAK